MNSQCGECGFTFNKEPGYFLGSFVIAYFIGAFSTIPTLVLCLFVLKTEVMPAVAFACLQLILLNPILFRFSRLAWLHSDSKMSRMLDGKK